MDVDLLALVNILLILMAGAPSTLPLLLNSDECIIITIFFLGPDGLSLRKDAVMLVKNLTDAVDGLLGKTGSWNSKDRLSTVLKKIKKDVSFVVVAGKVHVYLVPFILDKTLVQI